MRRKLTVRFVIGGHMSDDALVITSFKHDVHNHFLRYRIEGAPADTFLNIDFVLQYTLEPVGEK